tara:strand:+ start:27720 stop:29189 length:1470 start_codon:yes stop_codon:yes gene_type:complete
MGKIKNIISPEKDSLQFPDTAPETAEASESASSESSGAPHDPTDKVQKTKCEPDLKNKKSNYFSMPLSIIRQIFPTLTQALTQRIETKDETAIPLSNPKNHKPKIATPYVGFVDEEGLLPGAHETTEYCGMIDIDSSESNEDKKHSLQFLPLVQQQSLLDLNLTANGIPLYYTLHKNKELNASQGANGDLVFKATLEPDGEYRFILFTNIDRTGSSNLIANPNFETGDNHIPKDIAHLAIPGWEVKTIEQKNHIVQDIHTRPFETYQFTIYFSSNQAKDENMSPIDIYWENEHLIHLDQSDVTTHTYTFSVTGGNQSSSQLKFVAENDNVINQLIKNATLESRAQHMLPILLGFVLLGEDGERLESHFTINVTTTPPLEINNDIPIDIMFEQSVYQTIIVNDDNKTSTNPLTKINLDTLFDTMTIPEENRQVNVIQREENGVKTNVYEVMISDKTETQDPITVADVQLSFPGGEGGLSVFMRNIIIDDL